jgi:hypothetical protein
MGLSRCFRLLACVGDGSAGQEVVLGAVQHEGMHGQGDAEDGDENGHQPDVRVSDGPDFPVVFRVLRAGDRLLSHGFALCFVGLLGLARSQVALGRSLYLGPVVGGAVLEPGLPGQDQQVGDGSDAGKRGVGDLPLLVELFGLLVVQCHEGPPMGRLGCQGAVSALLAGRCDGRQ